MYNYTAQFYYYSNSEQEKKMKARNTYDSTKFEIQ